VILQSFYKSIQSDGSGDMSQQLKKFFTDNISDSKCLKVCLFVMFLFVFPTNTIDNRFLKLAIFQIGFESCASKSDFSTSLLFEKQN
jgi:hypothetical protein